MSGHEAESREFEQSAAAATISAPMQDPVLVDESFPDQSIPSGEVQEIHIVDAATICIDGVSKTLSENQQAAFKCLTENHGKQPVLSADFVRYGFLEAHTLAATRQRRAYTVKQLKKLLSSGSDGESLLVTLGNRGTAQYMLREDVVIVKSEPDAQRQDDALSEATDSGVDFFQEESKVTVDVSSSSIGQRPLDPYKEGLAEVIQKYPRRELSEEEFAAVLQKFEGWQMARTKPVRGMQSYELKREIEEHFTLDGLDTLESPRRLIRQRANTLRVRSLGLTTNDLQCLLTLERAVAIDTSVAAKKTITEKYSRLVQEHRKAAASRSETDLSFTDYEKAILSLVTTFTVPQLATHLGVSQSTVSRVVKPMRERLGVQDNIDLILYAIVNEFADYSHVPRGLTEALGDEAKQLIRDRYSADPALRIAAGEGSQRHVSKWSRSVYAALKIEGRQQVLLCALQDGLLDVEELRRYLESRRLAVQATR